MRRLWNLLSVGIVAGVLAGCGTLADNARTPGLDEYNDDSRRARVRGRLAGENGILIFGNDRSGAQQRATGGGGEQAAGIGVNAFLWRATLDTLSFMPLTSADPFGGVIVTDWYSPPGTPGERFKATAYILSRQLRSDGVRVVVFRQELRGSAWVDAPVAAGTGTEIEDQVLNRARELRAQSTAAAR
ncbi:DUF3576 domain-containing protein [Falsiroseomonas sp. CW058]|uniref:DUF3576 domain-containing protein n=1 Tax=Falsiroseomonas sp. CW058 TaxID=3388664 RepID=UPI003D31C9EE